jgi:hypothetical protein
MPIPIDTVTDTILDSAWAYGKICDENMIRSISLDYENGNRVSALSHTESTRHL